jgi:hypothetical protein
MPFYILQNYFNKHRIFFQRPNTTQRLKTLSDPTADPNSGVHAATIFVLLMVGN